MNRKDLEKILDEHYTRYTVRTFSDPKRAGVIEIWLPGKIVSFVFGYKLRVLTPVNTLISAYKLPWWKNRILRRKWLLV